MKVLHVNNTASVPQTLAMYQRNMLVDADVIYRSSTDLYDPVRVYQFDKLYPEAKIIDGSARKFLFQVIRIARKYDVIHVHALVRTALRIRQVYKKKPIVMTFHGQKARGKWHLWEHALDKFNLVTVSTKDLLKGAPEGVLYTPNTVNLENLHRKNLYMPHTALWTSGAYGDQREAKKLAREKANELGCHLAIHDITEDLFPSVLYPRFLELFEYYLDYKQIDGKILDPPVLTTTALQVLGLHGKVILQGKLYDKLPEEHEPAEVTENWIERYKSLLE